METSHFNVLRFSLLTAASVSSALAESRVYAEAGASYLALRGARFESSPAPFFVSEGSKAAPFIAAGYSFNERFGLRASYHYAGDVSATAGYGHQPGATGPVIPPVVVDGHYTDDVHLVGLAPELRWAPAERVNVSYQYTDLDPSWDREAHVVSGALRLNFQPARQINTSH